MVEYMELMNRQEGKNGKGQFAAVKRYREAKRKLIQRADSLKGKDEARRQKLMKSADKLTSKAMSYEEVRRKAAIAEVDLAVDELRHMREKNVKK